VATRIFTDIRSRFAFPQFARTEDEGMPINRLLSDRKLAPEEVARLNQAYTFALRSLSLVNRNDPITDIVARKVMEVCSKLHDPKQIAALVVMKIGA
jgi:hypothetical protein